MKKIKFIIILILGISSFPWLVKAEEAIITQPDSSHQVRLVVLTRSNGSGIVTSSDGKISCGSGQTACYAYYGEGDSLTLSAKPSTGSTFKGWSNTYDNSNRDSVYLDDTFSFNVAANNPNIPGNEIVYAKFVLNSMPSVPEADSADRQIPRVMFWWGKVNQHWDLSSGAWQTDPDGVSGARENKLAYCQKFYPETVKVVEHKQEMANTWKDAGNVGSYVSIKTSYRCVLAGEENSGQDVSNVAEKTNQGSICYYFPNLPLCVPFGSQGAATSTNNQGEYKKIDSVRGQQIKSDLQALKTNVQAAVASGQDVDSSKEKLAGVLLKSLQAETAKVATATRVMSNFVAYGADSNTRSLSLNGRASALNSYRLAYGKLPASDEEMAQVVRIASGQLPEVASPQAENKARQEFKKIYKRAAVSSSSVDMAAVKIMAYGLKPQPSARNLEAEKQAIKTFSGVYKRIPKNAWDWNIVSAIAYSNVKSAVQK